MISTLASILVSIKGKPINIRDYSLFMPFYDSTPVQSMMKTGRQVGKSTALAVKQVLKSCFKEHTYILTIMPLQSQSYRFSKLYVDPIFNGSDILGQRLNTKLSNTITLKELTNGSRLHYSYLGDGEDRIRGISVKEIYWDEIQDIHYDDMPMAEQCTSSFNNPKFCYTGTPKTLSNTIESLWKRSSQHEPYITCNRCRKENFCTIPDVYKMIEPKGLVCQSCRQLLSREDICDCRYTPLDKSKVDLFNGYHVPQIFTPLAQDRWDIIYLNYSNYSQFTFATEVLGLSFDQGGKPITLEQLMSLCQNRKMESLPKSNYAAKVMGIDWGYATHNSLTVMTIIGMRLDGKMEVLFSKKFRYRDRILQRQEIVGYFKQFGCRAMGVDHGVGLTDNLELRKELGCDKIFEYQYCNPKKILNFLSDLMLYSANRTKTLSLLFNDLTKKNIFFPCVEDSKPFFDDILSEQEELREGPNFVDKFYTRDPNIPDDFLHALNFAVLTGRIITKGSILDDIIRN